jgi:asparagine synthase (glutamine-hydrolysing)
MCGINGFVTTGDSRGATRIVDRMNVALAHRGPDEGGVESIGFGAVGMRRLSIVDLAHGRQPMTAPDGRFTLVYNGELYDTDRLRDQLTARGHTLRTHSDTEVLLHALIADGPGCLEYLNGMFSFALVDHHARTVFLARDHLGIKPLFYYLSPRGDLVFSSELRSLLVHPGVPRQLDHRSLAMLLVDRYVADPWTMFQGIRQLRPGHWLSWRAAAAETGCYYKPEIVPDTTGDRDWSAELDSVLAESVRAQLVADVPVGILLSGGIDSSTVAAYACRHASTRIKTFSVRFSKAEYDESHVARQVAAHLGTDHHEMFIADGSFDPALLDLIVDHVGQPLADISCIPTYLVARFARQHVKVVLSGDGGDELFGGYDYIAWAGRVRRVAEWVPRSVRRAALTALNTLAPLAYGRLATPIRHARKGLGLTFCPPAQQLRWILALWREDDIRQLLSGDPSSPVLRPLFDFPPADAARLAPEEHAMAALTQTKLPGAILAKVDRMSMAASLEVRPPLLDRRVVQLAMRLPLGLKIAGGTGKRLLRDVGRPLLPEAVYRHRKQGFSLPLFDWFDHRFWELLDDLYAPGSRAASLFRRGPLEQTIAQGRNALSRPGLVSDYVASSRVWQLAMLGRWIDRFGVTL